MTFWKTANRLGKPSSYQAGHFLSPCWFLAIILKTIKKVIRSRFDKDYIAFENSYKELSEKEINNIFSEQSKTFQKNNKYGGGELCTTVLHTKDQSCLSRGDGRKL